MPDAVPYADLTDPQSLNQYTYVRNLPTTKIDSDGHWARTNPEQVVQMVEDIGKGLANGSVDVINYFHRVIEDPSGQGFGGQIPEPFPNGSPLTKGVQAVTPFFIPGGEFEEVGYAVKLEEELEMAATRAASRVEGEGAVSGTKIHAEFEAEVKALNNPNISTEISYKNGKVV